MTNKRPKHNDLRLHKLPWHPILPERTIVERWDEPRKGAGCWVYAAEYVPPVK